MKVLVACEESQRVCIAFRKKGHEAYSCDLIEPSGGHPEWHILGDVIPLLGGRCNIRTMDGIDHGISDKWDMVIAFPPCTHLAVSGARWFPEKQRDFRQQKAVVFFMYFALAHCEKVAVENPVGIMSGIYRKPTQIIHPYQFGHPYRKSTCLWLRGLPPLVPTNIVEPEVKSYTTKDGRTVTFDELGWRIKNARERSKTFQGIADAMAEQWG